MYEALRQRRSLLPKEDVKVSGKKKKK